MVFENYSRSEAALVVTMAEMVVNGVSTRKVSQVMETLCGKEYSKFTVSKACKELDAAVAEFQGRPLEGEYPLQTVDATYFKVREQSRVISKAFMIAYATDGDGFREIVGFGVYGRENKENRNDFLRRLKDRSLKGVRMIISDAHKGIRDAVARQFPEAAWQRCQFHFSKNIADKAPKKYQAGIRSELQEMFKAVTYRKLGDDGILQKLSKIADEQRLLCAA